MYKLKNIICLLALTALLNTASFSQSPKITKVEPANWWTGMNYNKIQLMVYGSNLNNVSAEFNNKALKVGKVHKTENPDYAFIDVEVTNKVKPGSYTLTLSNGNKKVNWKYRILERQKPEGRFQGFGTKDVLYLITPDRFANGDTLNDNMIGLADGYNPSAPYGRHGGDIQGIIDHLDYLKDLGVTVLWINPLVENNTRVSYHGYAATDLYKIDIRFGTNDLYTKLVSEAHKRGLKVILDHVNNHIGLNHPWMNKIPMKSWVHGSREKHMMTPHYGRSIYDIHSDTSEINVTRQGWFVDDMPDLNQSNPFVAKYMIQNTIWWIESSGLDGIREDTYFYTEPNFNAEWAKTILAEYPKFNIVGEVWIGEPAFLAPFQANSKVSNFNTNLPAVTDFGIRDALAGIISENKSFFTLYENLAKDFLFANPNNLVTFVDNHDVERVMYLAKDDVNKFKIAMGLLLTTRGIPQIYYGTEIGLKGGPDHGTIREDFPGGFKNSSHNAFNKDTRTQKESDIYNFMKKLISLRKNSAALSSGRLVHYPPVNETYYYFRISRNEKYMVVINYNNDKKEVDLSLGSKQLGSTTKLIDILTGTEKEIVNNKIQVEPYSIGVFKL